MFLSSATEGWKGALLRNYKFLVNDTQLFMTTDECLAEDVITLEEREKVENAFPNTIPEKNRQFLKILLRKSERLYNLFLGCLTEEHDEVKRILTDTKATRIQQYNENGAEISNLRRKVYRNYDDIIMTASLDGYCDDFVSSRIFGINDWERVTNITLTTDEKNKEFLDTLLMSKSQGCNLLMDLLIESHSDLVSKIKSTFVDETVDKEIEEHIKKNQREPNWISIRNPADLDGEFINTTLVKTGRGFGFEIIGGGKRDGFVQIKNVDLNGPAYRTGKLQKGDVLVYVDKKCVLSFTHHAIVNLFRDIHIEQKVELVVCRGYPLQPEMLLENIRQPSALEKQTLLQIDSHREDNTFVVTKAVKTGIEMIKENGMLIYSGNPGDGKTENALEVMAKFKESHPHWIFLKLDQIEKWSDVHPDMESLILLDDCLGSTNTNISLISEDCNYWRSIQTCIEKGQVKVIMTVRKSILAKNLEKLQMYKIFGEKHTIDLTSDMFKLTKDEKRKILKNHLERNHISVCKSNISKNINSQGNDTDIKINSSDIEEIIDTNPFIGFPQTSSMFCAEQTYTKQGVRFFKNPSKSLIDEIMKLNDLDSKASEKLQFCLLSYMFLKDGSIDIEHLDRDLLKQVLNTSPTLLEPRNRDIQSTLENLSNKYIVKGRAKGTYRFKHQTILESIVICFSEDNIVKLLQLCSRKFLYEFVRPQSYIVSEGEIIVKLKQGHYIYLIDRFRETLLSGEGIERYRWWIRHPVLDDKMFVDSLVKEIKENSPLYSVVDSCVRGLHGIIWFSKLFGKSYLAKSLFDLFDVSPLHIQFPTMPYPVRKTENDLYPNYRSAYTVPSKPNKSEFILPSQSHQPHTYTSLQVASTDNRRYRQNQSHTVTNTRISHTRTDDNLLHHHQNKNKSSSTVAYIPHHQSHQSSLPTYPSMY